jgi:hypothetical protein
MPTANWPTRSVYAGSAFGSMAMGQGQYVDRWVIDRTLFEYINQVNLAV